MDFEFWIRGREECRMVNAIQNSAFSIQNFPRGKIGVSQRFLTAFTPFSPAAPAYRATFSYKFFHRSVKSFAKNPSTTRIEIPARDANSTPSRTTEAATPRLDCELRLFPLRAPRKWKRDQRNISQESLTDPFLPLKFMKVHLADFPWPRPFSASIDRESSARVAGSSARLPRC